MRSIPNQWGANKVNLKVLLGSWRSWRVLGVLAVYLPRKRAKALQPDLGR